MMMIRAVVKGLGGAALFKISSLFSVVWRQSSTYEEDERVSVYFLFVFAKKASL